MNNMKHTFKLLALLTFLIFAPNAIAQYKFEKLSNWSDESISPIGNQKFSDLWGYADSAGREYIILGSVDGTNFINVSNPEEPVLIQKFPGRYNQAINRDFHTYKHYAYGVADQGPSSLQIFDLQYLPDSVVKVYDSTNLLTRTHNIFIDNSRLYLASHTDSDGNFHALSVLSLEDPANPVLIATLEPPVINGRSMIDHVHDLHVRNDTAYLFSGNDGLFIYDYRDPLNPRLLSALTHYGDKGYNHSGWLNDAGTGLVFADETKGSRLKYINVSDIRNPNQTSMFGSHHSDGSVAHNPLIRDTLVFVSYYHLGVVAFDKSNPTDIRKVAAYDTYPQSVQSDGKHNFSGFNGCWGVYPLLPSGTIAASDMTNGLFLFRLEEDPNAFLDQKTEKQNLSIYPNPFQQGFSIQTDNLQPGTFRISITDLSGRTIMEKQADIYANMQVLSVDMQKYPAGTYLVYMQNDQAIYRSKVLKK